MIAAVKLLFKSVPNRSNRSLAIVDLLILAGQAQAVADRVEIVDGGGDDGGAGPVGKTRQTAGIARTATVTSMVTEVRLTIILYLPSEHFTLIPGAYRKNP